MPKMIKKKSTHGDLINAKKEKADDYYTLLSDIEKELKHYKRSFKNKIVLCNCDDPRVSNFFHYFSYNFERLGLKKLITTCYKNQSVDLFSQSVSEKAIFLEYTGDKNNNKIPDIEEIKTKDFKGDGDFRSDECINLLKKSDIVVTNPPFSLFREYVAQLIQNKKKFIIIGHQNALSYKDIFKLIKEKKLWLGFSIKSGDREFQVPDNYKLTSKSKRIDSDGKQYVKVPGVRWFTNIEYKERYEDIELYKTYKGNKNEYPKYFNYDAIDVSKTKEIPLDYKGEMGVPISFINRYNPDQFEIIALGIVNSINFKSQRKMEILDKVGSPTGNFTINAKGTLYRLHNSKRDTVAPSFKDCETGALYQSIYARIIIKNKKI